MAGYDQNRSLESVALKVRPSQKRSLALGEADHRQCASVADTHAKPGEGQKQREGQKQKFPAALNSMSAGKLKSSYSGNDD